MNEWTARKDSITLPRNVFKPGEVTLVARMSFKTLGHFLPHRWNRKRHVIFTDGYVVNSNVISCAVHPKLSFQHNATVTIVLQHLKESNPAESKCVFWDVNDRDNTGGSWSTEGCWVDFTNKTTTVCKCSHLTHFAVLSNINDQKISEKEQKRENVVVAAWLGIPVAVILLLGSLYVCFAWTKNPRRRHVVIMDKRPTFPDKEVVVTQTISEKYPGSPNRYLYAANCTPSPSELEWEHAWDVLTDCESHDCKDKRRPKETMNKNESTEPALNVGSKLLDTSFCVAIDDMPYTSIFTLHEVTKYFQISFEPNATLTESKSLNDETESTCSEDTLKNGEYMENRKKVKEEEEKEITTENVEELRIEGENIELEACEMGSIAVNVYEDGCKTTLFDLVKTKDVLPNSACQDISLEHENVTEKHITFSSVQTFIGVDLSTFSRIHYCFISKLYILLKENFLVRKYVRFSRMVVLTEQNNSRRKDLQKEQTVLLTPFVKPTIKSISTLKSTLHTTSISPPSTLTVITSTTALIPTFRNDWSLWKDIDYTQPIKNVVESTVHKYMTMEKQLHKINRASKELSFEGSNKTTSNSQTIRQKDVKATTNVGHNFRTQTAHMRSYIALRQQSRRNDIQLTYRSTTRKPKIYKSVTFKRKMGSREGSESKLKNPSIPSPQQIANRPNTKEEFLNVLKLNKAIVGTKSSR
ncbi:uncharacterized protein LOC130641855 [Hydractinia symbiolongicarpus]|uniref:uncharacterized protein LOC130641855 n=1 Tax=Hydractinia symbiolongicarpus TaxID=13093 RepID=UPI00254EEEEE|nr:uncharacterized protein LOC130641855 [Hydractinia symbiolongicarpus]